MVVELVVLERRLLDSLSSCYLVLVICCACDTMYKPICNLFLNLGGKGKVFRREVLFSIQELLLNLFNCFKNLLLK